MVDQRKNKGLAIKLALSALLKWIEPELKEMFPKPGSFSGLMIPFILPGILWMKFKKWKAKK